MTESTPGLLPARDDLFALMVGAGLLLTGVVKLLEFLLANLSAMVVAASMSTGTFILMGVLLLTIWFT